VLVLSNSKYETALVPTHYSVKRCSDIENKSADDERTLNYFNMLRNCFMISG